MEPPGKTLNAPVLVGDNVVLIPYADNDTIVSCEKEGEMCKIDGLCTTETGGFHPYCAKQVLSIAIPGKHDGDVIVHGDFIELRHDSSNRKTWIGCDPLNTRKCRRFGCPNNTHDNCNHEQFQIYIL